MPSPLCPPGSLAAEVLLLELLEVFLSEHGALGLLLLLLDHRPVTGLATPILAHNLQGVQESGSLGGNSQHKGLPLGAAQPGTAGQVLSPHLVLTSASYCSQLFRAETPYSIAM